jgi:hypothetical protein
MRDIITYKLLYKFFVLAGLSLCLWAVSARTTKNTQTVDQFIPVVITEQLDPKNGVIPVDIRCGQARLTAPNRLEEFQCTLKNNTNVNIIAANAIYSVVLEQNGVLTKDTTSRTVQAAIHPDFRGTNRLIGPGDESSLGPPGPITYTSGISVKSVEIAMDYVEFEDGTTLGSDNQGSHIIKAMRVGAAKYREWLKLRYMRGGRSVASISSEVEGDQSLPSELRFADPNEEQGAIGYRSLLRNLFRTRGAGDVKKLLDSKLVVNE